VALWLKTTTRKKLATNFTNYTKRLTVAPGFCATLTDGTRRL